MPARSVPDLGAKLRLLLQHSPYCSWDALGVRLQRSPKTIMGWSTDDRGRDAQSVPEAVYAMLIEILAETLPQLPHEVLAALLDGPPERLADAILVTTDASLATLITREAKREGVALIRDDGLALTAIGAAGDRDLPVVRLSQRFRLEFPARRNLRHAYGIQQAGPAWGAFAPTLDATQPIYHLPGSATHDGAPRLMAEHSSAGPHRFTCLYASRSFPPRLPPITASRCRSTASGSIFSEPFCTSSRRIGARSS